MSRSRGINMTQFKNKTLCRVYIEININFVNSINQTIKNLLKIITIFNNDIKQLVLVYCNRNEMVEKSKNEDAKKSELLTTVRKDINIKKG